MNGADTTDKIHFDAITIKGRTNTNAIGNIVTLAAVTKSFNIKGFANELPDDRSLSGIQVYPNPVKSRLHVAGITGIKHVRIFSVSGSVLGCFDNVSDLDVSGLTKGVYILEIESIEGVTRRRFLKE